MFMPNRLAATAILIVATAALAGCAYYPAYGYRHGGYYAQPYGNYDYYGYGGGRPYYYGDRGRHEHEEEEEEEHEHEHEHEGRGR